jgi:Flp pilus assembly protein TadG
MFQFSVLRRKDVPLTRCAARDGVSKKVENHMELTKHTAAPGVHVGTRSPGRRLRARRRTGNDGGQALLEFALILPLLMLLVMGMLVFGIAFYNYLVLTDAVGIGGRALALDRGQCVGTSCPGTTDPCAATATVIENAAPSLNLATTANVTFTFVFNGTTVYGPGSSPSCSSSSTTTGASADLVEDEPASVKVTYPCNLVVFGHNFAPSGCTLTAQVQELVQ